MITFEFRGRSYVVGDDAVTKGRIVLPSSAVLKVVRWAEYSPPTPAEIDVDWDTSQKAKIAGLTGLPESIAYVFECALAHAARRIPEAEFRFLAKNDKVFYGCGLTPANHVEADAVVVDGPGSSVEIEIIKIYSGDLQLYQHVCASSFELFRSQ